MKIFNKNNIMGKKSVISTRQIVKTHAIISLSTATREIVQTQAIGSSPIATRQICQTYAILPQLTATTIEAILLPYLSAAKNAVAAYNNKALKPPSVGASIFLPRTAPLTTNPFPRS